MSLKEQIEQDIKSAMLAKNKEDLTALRAIKSAILLAETEKGASGALSEDGELKLLTKAAKQRRESAEIYIQQGRQDLAAVEKKELEVISRYLPKALSEVEVRATVEDVIRTTGAEGMKDMGKVMGVATKQLAGQADGKTISQIVKQLLAG